MSKHSIGIREYQLQSLIFYIIQVFNETITGYRKTSDAALSIYNRLKSYRRYSIEPNNSPNSENIYFNNNIGKIVIKEKYYDADGVSIWNVVLVLTIKFRTIQVTHIGDLKEINTGTSQNNHNLQERDIRSETLSHSNRNNQNFQINRSQGNQSQGNQSQGKQAQGNQSQGNQSQGKQAQGNQSQGNRSQVNGFQPNRSQPNQSEINRQQVNQNFSNIQNNLSQDQYKLPTGLELSNREYINPDLNQSQNNYGNPSIGGLGGSIGSGGSGGSGGISSVDEIDLRMN